MIGRKFLKAFGWFWIWELVNYAVGVFMSVFLGAFYRVIISTLIFAILLFTIVYSRRSSKYESKKKYLEENPPENITVKRIFLTALKSPEYIPEIIGTAPIILVMGLYWGLWLLAKGFNDSEKITVIFVVFIIGTIGFAVLNLINRFMVYRNWVNDYLEVVNEYQKSEK